MLLGAHWNGGEALFDPMCGSGTLPIEAALIARRIAPGLRRSFAAERWPSADARIWAAEREAAKAAVQPRALVAIGGSDRDQGAVDSARANAERAGVGADVTFCTQPVSAARANDSAGLLVVNPPYGHRVGDSSDVRDVYARLGQVARTRFAGWHVAVLSADRSPGHVLERQLALPLREAWRSSNGGIPVRLLTAPIPADTR
jgi:putative N6-adenine-specific DNA methylase